MPGLTFSASKLTVLIVATALSVLAVEIIFRWMGYDFEKGQEEAQEAYPIFYRQPREPLGDIFYYRRGPVTWTGNVLGQAYTLSGGTGDDYENLPAITVSYDEEGLRNPKRLSDWEVAVVGDSFVELGHLPQEALFTTQLGNLLGQRVKNIGVSYSGPLTYVAYLEHFGISSAGRHALMVFFEGNDLMDLEREVAAQRRYEVTGHREKRQIEPQTSFLRSLYRLITQRARQTEPQVFFGEQAITLHYTPPSAAELSDDVRTILDSTLAQWTTVAQLHGMQPWLVYMPCKRRILEGYLRGSLPAWQPGDLPTYVEKKARQHGMDFIDLTPVLRRETAKGKLTYNGVWDTHLNRHGTAVVARTLAEMIGR